MPHNKHIILSILFAIATFNLFNTTKEIINSSARLEALNTEVSDLEEKKKDLQVSIDHKKSNDYIEETARNELNLVKQGEKVFVLIKGSNDKGISRAPDEGAQKPVVAGISKSLVAENESKLHEWLELLF